MKADRSSPQKEGFGPAEPACFTPHAEGVVFAVRAQPGARKTGFQGMLADAAKLGVGAPPEDGKANEALITLIAELLGIRKSQIELIQGKSSRHKRFLIRGLSCAQARATWLKTLAPKD